MVKNRVQKHLRIAGTLLILGLVIEAICLLWGRPLAFLVLVGAAGVLCAAGIGVYLYALVSIGQSEPEGSSQ